MLLTNIPGEDLHLDLERPVMEPEAGFDNILRIGEVVTFDAVRLAHGELDPQVEQLVTACDFTLVRMPISVRPTEKAVVRFLSVDVALMGNGTCWSADPERVEHETKVTTTCSMSVGLKPKVLEVSAADERATEYVVRQPEILAFGIGLTEIAWEFTPAHSQGLAGVQLLHCVVKSPRGSVVAGTVGIRADIMAHGLLWNTRAVGRDATTAIARFGT